MSQAIEHIQRKFGLKPNGIIHVGANTGQEVPLFKGSGIRPVLLIEPLPDAFQALEKAVGGEAGFYPVQACCAAVGGRLVDFHVASNKGASSSYLKPKAHLKIAPQVRFDRTIKMETSTLDQIVSRLKAEHGLPAGAFDYLALDTQGAERDVLLGAEQTLSEIKFVWLEVTFGGLYAGDDDVYRMIRFMRRRRFDLYYVSIGPRSWGDALFIRGGLMARGRLDGRRPRVARGKNRCGNRKRQRKGTDR
jgi:FkbM family methyltransferase